MIVVRRTPRRALSAMVLAAAGALVQAVCAAQPIVFSTFTDPHTNPNFTAGTIGFTYAGNKFVGSVQKDGTGALYSTDLSGGSVQVFAPTVSLIPSGSAEHFVAASLGQAGFPLNDVYVAAGNTIVHINNAGTASNVFASGLSGDVRGIRFDVGGAFGNDMLVTTSTGTIYRINSAGVVSTLATVGEDTEGLDIAPAGFGSFGGQLVVASEGSGSLRAITTGGTVSLLPFTISGGPEELNFVPLTLGSGNPIEGFYGANYTPNVQYAGAPQFATMLGDAIVTSEFSHTFTQVHWNGSAFVQTNRGNFPAQPEDGLFVTAAHINAQVPEPGSLAMLLGSGLGGSLFCLRRARRLRRR